MFGHECLCGEWRVSGRGRERERDRMDVSRWQRQKIFLCLCAWRDIATLRVIVLHLWTLLPLSFTGVRDLIDIFLNNERTVKKKYYFVNKNKQSGACVCSMCTYIENDIPSWRTNSQPTSTTLYGAGLVISEYPMSSHTEREKRTRGFFPCSVVKCCTAVDKR